MEKILEIYVQFDAGGHGGFESGVFQTGDTDTIEDGFDVSGQLIVGLVQITD